MKSGRSIAAGVTMTLAAILVSPANAEILVGVAGTFSGPAAWGFGARASRILSEYRANYPVEQGTPSIDMYFNAYSAFQVWAEAVEEAGSLDVDSVTKVLRTYEFDTVFGTVGFDEKGDVTGVDLWSWWVRENGRWVEKAADELPRVK